MTKAERDDLIKLQAATLALREGMIEIEAFLRSKNYGAKAWRIALKALEDVEKLIGGNNA